MLLLSHLIGDFVLQTKKMSEEKAGNIRKMLLHCLLVGISFVYAAKSILRYADNKTVDTEYVLVGTLMSFVISIGCGLLVIYC